MDLSGHVIVSQSPKKMESKMMDSTGSLYIPHSRDMKFWGVEKMLTWVIQQQCLPDDGGPCTPALLGLLSLLLHL